MGTDVAAPRGWTFPEEYEEKHPLHRRPCEGNAMTCDATVRFIMSQCGWCWSIWQPRLAKSKGSSCLLFKWAVTAFWLCMAAPGAGELPISLPVWSAVLYTQLLFLVYAVQTHASTTTLIPHDRLEWPPIPPNTKPRLKLVRGLWRWPSLEPTLISSAAHLALGYIRRAFCILYLFSVTVLNLLFLQMAPSENTSNLCMWGPVGSCGLVQSQG